MKVPMLTLSSLQLLFPRDVTANASLVGRIPMSFVEQHLPDFAAIVKENNLRRIYRGPRNAYSNDTRRNVAVAMVLYAK